LSATYDIAFMFVLTVYHLFGKKYLFDQNHMRRIQIAEGD